MSKGSKYFSRNGLHVQPQNPFLRDPRLGFSAGAVSDGTSPSLPTLLSVRSSRVYLISPGPWFTPGLGACGANSLSADLIVALSPSDYAAGAHTVDCASASPALPSAFHALTPFAPLIPSPPALSTTIVPRFWLVLTPCGPTVNGAITVVDLRPSCAPGSIDLSPAAFSALASLGAGRVEVDWVFA
ncbi:hypothetical protein GLOTRDRAFT_131169 [Gloeophyllum trabeum ATCC 11539]|uniref:RlpA-like protein double-psi beta-barrel domain-containing protein n=1 Tax=Gloeophyllum trabeum (strain ATCC 11539 / FP-39264 / Madison 617) TaxID=670483 RepID=S7RHS4_GLOTA|nr:uncharacterized protein GLOTRDRAFT_131169 [Gloeophyllum trabeum ATCC 11539]EPQ53840.1 hypothetical protein GLOTRDRAFT_131169 [Gloeophyllum trabeum ATCC 11539]